VSVFDPGEQIIPRKEAKRPTPSASIKSYADYVGNKKGWQQYRLTRNQTINNTLHVKPNESLTIEKNVALRFGIEGKILVEGEMRILGSQKHPVKLTPSQKTWGGIYFSRSKGKNLLQHTQISSARNYADFMRQGLGAVNVVYSEVHFRNCHLTNISAPDAINIYHGRIIFERSSVVGSKDDALDSDFSNGEIKKSAFISNGGDGIDLNQSFFQITGNEIRGNSDKGISVGEKSVATISRNIISKNSQGIAVKDSSDATIEHNFISRNQIGIASFIKKHWYTKPTYRQIGNQFVYNGTQEKWMGFNRY